MRRLGRHELPPPARGSVGSTWEDGWRSFGWRASIRTHRGVRAAAEPSDAGPSGLTRRGLEVASLEALDRVDDRGAAAVEILGGQELLAILLETRGPADAEDDLPHVAPDPFLRVPEREELWREPTCLAFLVHTFPTSHVVEGELHVIQLRPKVGLVGVLHRFPRSGLVVHDLDLAVADVVDAVDLADELRTLELQAEPDLRVDGAQAADLLHAGDEADVVGQQRADLALFTLAVEDALHVHEIGLEVTLQR